MKINFTGAVGAEGDAYIAACRRILRWGSEDLVVNVFANPRDRYGCLEWHIQICDAMSKPIIFIGMIQAKPGDEFSFHS